jgi:hypothetical protein
MIQGDSNMTGTDLCVNKPGQSRSYLNHLLFIKCCLIEFRYWNNSLPKRNYFYFKILGSYGVCHTLYHKQKQFLKIYFLMILITLHHSFSTLTSSASKFYIMNLMFRKLILLPSSEKGEEEPV